MCEGKKERKTQVLVKSGLQPLRKLLLLAVNVVSSSNRLLGGLGRKQATQTTPFQQFASWSMYIVEVHHVLTSYI